MRSTIVVLGTLGLLACSRERTTEKPGETTITGATTDAGVTVEEIRLTLIERGPKGQEALSGVTISSDNGVVTLRGKVEDEETKRNMLNTVRGMPNVKSVRDELQIAPKAQEPGTQRMMPPGTGDTTKEKQAAEPPAGAQPQAGTADDTAKGKQAAEPPAGAQAPAAPARNADSVRAHLKKDKAAPETVLDELIITDDGNMIILSGTVPDQATHDAVLKSAQKTPGVKGVRNELKIKGK